ncbi:hypothetical protein IKA92_03085 [bacterium]|nr:hypothetical protein [bacterium]
MDKIKPNLPKGVVLEEINVSENTEKNQRLIEEYSILIVPSTVFVDNYGKIRKKSSSIITSSEIMQEIENILKEF